MRRFQVRLHLIPVLLVALCVLGSRPVYAQAPTVISASTPQVTLVPISSTAAVNTATTLTITAAPGLYNYVCYLAYNLSNDGTGGAITNVTSSNTNFGTFAVKVSSAGTANTDTGTQVLLQGSPATGCAKSAVAGTATTFVSPASVTHATWTWYATYFQAP